MTRAFAPAMKAEAATRPLARSVTPDRRAEDGRVATGDDLWTEVAALLLDMLEADSPGAGATSGPRPGPPPPDALPSTVPPPEAAGATARQSEAADPAGRPVRDAALPAGSETRLLKGEEKAPVAGPVAMPAFPKGDRPLPEAAPPQPPAATAPPPAPLPGRASPETDRKASPGAIVRRWQGRVSASGGAIPAPDVKVPPAGVAGVARVAKGAQDRNARAREGMTQDAIATVPKPPELDTTPPAPPPPNPVPEHTSRVLAASGKRLPDQQSIGLAESPKRDVEGQAIGGSLPPLGVRPVDADLFQILITPSARTIAALPAGATPEQRDAGHETREQKRVRIALETLTRTDQTADRTARGPQVIAPDAGPFKAEGVSPEGRAQIGELVARLMANTHASAEDILVRLRKQAFPNQVLFKTFPDLCPELLPGLEAALTGDLRDIADAAGVTGVELDAMVAKRRKELEASSAKAAATVTQERTDATATIAGEGQKTSDQIAGAAEAAQEETLRRQAAVAGENDPAVVNARRDRIVAWFREHVTTQITTYQRAGDKRRTELSGARDEQQDGYRTLAQREIYQVMTPAAPRPERDPRDVAREKALADVSVSIRFWTDDQLKLVGEHFRKALGVAATVTRDHRKAVEEAGSAGIEAARQWAEDRNLAGKGWWQRFVARLRRWLGEARDVNEQWRVRRGRENAKAILDDVMAAELAAKALAKEVDENAARQINQMTDAQKLAFGTYYNKSAGVHPLDFAEMRLRDNLARDHQPNANETFEKALIAMPVGDGEKEKADKLNDVAREQGGGFNAARISESVHAAMDQWGTDEQRIFDSLRSLTVLQGAVVRKMYRARYHSDLDDDLESEMSGEELDQAMAELEGKQAKADAIALHDAMAGIGTDEATIMRTLRNKSEAEREAIRAEYLRMYGVTLDKDLEGDLSEGNEIAQANALLAGDNELADAIEFDEAMRGGIVSAGTDEGRITAIQTRVRDEVLAMARDRHMTAQEMEAEVRRRLGVIDRKFSERYKDVEQYREPGLAGATVFRRALSSELSGAELDLANALQDNDLIRADTARIEIERTSFYASDDKINGVLRSQYERALEARRLDEGPARQARVRRLVDDLRGQKGVSDEEISRRRMALERQMEKELEDGAQVDSRMSMSDLKRVYQDKYFWPLDYVVETNMSGEDRNKARNMLAQGGRLEPLQEIEYATRTAGTDEETVRRVVGRMTKAELDVLAAQWEQRHKGKRFRDLLVDELDGRDLSDVLDMYDYGAPKSALEQIAQEERRVHRETTELTGALGGAAAGHEAAWMDAELARLQEMRRGLLRTDWPVTDEARDERARLSDEFDSRVERVQAAVEDHRRRIDSVTDLATQVVGVVVALVVAAIITVATAGTAGPVMVAVIASLYATVATMATKLLIKGGAYGTQDFAIDAAVGVVDAVMNAATAGLGTKILNPIKALVRGTGLPALAGRIGRTGIAQRLARMEGTGLVARAGRAVAPSRERVERAIATFVAEGIEDAASSVPSTAIQTLGDDNVWKGDPLGNFLSGAGMAVLQSAAMSRGLHAVKGIGGGVLGIARSVVFEPGNIGRVRELNRMISEQYGAYRRENPHASVGDFLASPHGRRLQADIDRSGLMREIRASAEAAERASVPRRARAEAEANVVKSPRNEATDAAAPRVDSEAQRMQAMRAVLPKSIREGTFVTPDPALAGRSVSVEPLRIGNRIVGVEIRVGPEATALDVALHAGTVDSIRKYVGFLGDIRRALRDFAQRAGPGMTVDSRGWEARGEVEKLGGLIYERLESLSGTRLGPEARARALTDFHAFEEQFHRHEAILADPVARRQPGRGFIAGESPRMRRGGGADIPEGTSRRRESDMQDARSEEDSGTPGTSRPGKRGARPPTASELNEIEVGERRAPDGSLTDEGRADLARRLDAARRQIDNAYARDDRAAAHAEARRILAETAALFGIEHRRLVDHVTTEGGEPTVRRALRRPPPTEEPLGPSGGATPVSDEVFLRALHDAMPRDPAAPARAGVDEIVARIASGDPTAQAELDALSNAPKDYSVQNISWAEMEAMLRGNRTGNADAVNPDTGTIRVGEGTIVIDGRRLDSGAAARDENGNRLFSFRHDFPPFSKAGRVVLQLANGRMRAWRTPDNTLVLETIAAPASRRQHHERSQPTHTEAGLKGPFTELAHALGAGLGSESPFGIRRALVYVNQELQGRGIEKYIADLRDHAPPGVTFTYRLEIGDQPVEGRLASAVYGIDMVIDGRRVPFMEFGIRTRPLPVDVLPGSVAARDLIDIDPLEPAGLGRLDHATRTFVEAFRSTVAPPVSITRFDVTDPVSPNARAAHLREATPDQVRSLVASDPRLRQIDVPLAHQFDQQALLRDIRQAKFRADHAELVIVDLRGSNLDAGQIAALRTAMSPLIYGRSGADVILVEPVTGDGP